jgi:hypothetical protein
VLALVKEFGINRSELHTRLGLALGVTFHEIAQAHDDMEHGRATGKLVVLP